MPLSMSPLCVALVGLHVLIQPSDSDYRNCHIINPIYYIRVKGQQKAWSINQNLCQCKSIWVPGVLSWIRNLVRLNHHWPIVLIVVIHLYPFMSPLECHKKSPLFLVHLHVKLLDLPLKKKQFPIVSASHLENQTIIGPEHSPWKSSCSTWFSQL